MACHTNIYVNWNKGLDVLLIENDWDRNFAYVSLFLQISFVIKHWWTVIEWLFFNLSLTGISHFIEVSLWDRIYYDLSFSKIRMRAVGMQKDVSDVWRMSAWKPEVVFKTKPATSSCHSSPQERGRHLSPLPLWERKLNWTHMLPLDSLQMCTWYA